MGFIANVFKSGHLLCWCLHGIIIICSMWSQMIQKQKQGLATIFRSMILNFLDGSISEQIGDIMTHVIVGGFKIVSEIVTIVSLILKKTKILKVSINYNRKLKKYEKCDVCINNICKQDNFEFLPL